MLNVEHRVHRFTGRFSLAVQNPGRYDVKSVPQLISGYPKSSPVGIVGAKAT
jgi:hypothetical protein